jgi:hypothetical protein
LLKGLGRFRTEQLRFLDKLGMTYGRGLPPEFVFLSLSKGLSRFRTEQLRFLDKLGMTCASGQPPEFVTPSLSRGLVVSAVPALRQRCLDKIGMTEY